MKNKFLKLVISLTIAFFVLATNHYSLIEFFVIQKIYAQDNQQRPGGTENEDTSTGKGEDLFIGDLGFSTLQRQLKNFGGINSTNQLIFDDEATERDFQEYLKLAEYMDSVVGSGDKEYTQEELEDIEFRYKQENGLLDLPPYDKRLIQSLVHLVTPKQYGGGGLEMLRISRLTKGHRTDSESSRLETEIPYDRSEDDELETQHQIEEAGAVDISATDYIRGTKFTIETEVDEFGNPKQDPVTGGPLERVTEVEHMKMVEIKHSDQADDNLGNSGAATTPFGGFNPNGLINDSPHSAANGAMANFLGENLASDRTSICGANDLSDDITPGEILKELGKGSFASRVDDKLYCIVWGPYALFLTGQLALEQATGIPKYGWFGNNLDELTRNIGREVIGQNLGLPEGSLLGNTSDEILASIGRRYFEKVLGNLPIRTLDLATGSRESLELATGRGIVAKLFDIKLEDVDPNIARDQFIAKLSFTFDLNDSTLVDNSLGISAQGGAENTRALLNGTLSPASWLRRIGQARLKILETYQNPDGALNLESRPLLLDLDPPAIQDANRFQKETTIVERAQWLIDNFKFKADIQEDLEEIAEFEPQPVTPVTPPSPFPSPFPTPTPSPVIGGDVSAQLKPYEFFLIEDEFTAWLFDNSYALGSNPDLGLTAGFLAGNNNIYREVGIDRIAKAVQKNPDEQSQLKAYLRDGNQNLLIPSRGSAFIDFNILATRVGLRSGNEFKAIFRENAPFTVYENAGRLALLNTLTKDSAVVQKSIQARIATPSEQKEAVNKLKEIIDSFASRFNDAKNSANQSLTQAEQIIDQASVKSFLETTEWNNAIAGLYKAGQAFSQETNANYREYSLALAELVHGVSGREFFDLTADRIILDQPVGFINDAREEFVKIIEETVSPNVGIENIGAHIITSFTGTEFASTKSFFTQALNLYKQNSIDTQIVNNAIVAFNNRHTNELQALAVEFGFARSEDLVKMFLAPVKPYIEEGAKSLSRTQNLENFSGPNGNGVLSILSSSSGQTAQDQFSRVLGIQKFLEAITGSSQSFNFSLSEISQNPGAIVARAFATDRLGTPNIDFSNIDTALSQLGGPFGVVRYIEQLTGENAGAALGQMGIQLAGNISQDAAALTGVLQQIISGDSGNDFWNTLGSTIQGHTGLPINQVINLAKGDFGSQGVQNFVFSQLQSQLTPGNIADFIGTDDPAFAGAISGSLNILLNPSISDKGGAFQSLGLQVGDSFAAQTFGFPISWAFNDQISGTQRVQFGMQALTQGLGLDPALGSLATSFYNTMFLEGGIDTSTLAGRQQLSGLITSIGAATGIPGDYLNFATQGLINGNMEQMVQSFAMSQLDAQFSQLGMPVSSGQIFELLAGPTAATQQLISQQAFNQVFGDGGPLGTGVESIINPLTGESVQVSDVGRALYEQRVQDLLGQRQQDMQFQMLDLALSQTLGLDIGLQNFAQNFFQGNPEQQLTALTGMLGNVAGSGIASQVFQGVELAQSLQTFFDNPSLSIDSLFNQQSLTQLEGSLSNLLGVDVPLGMAGQMLDFVQTGDISGALGSFAPQIGGFVDNTLGLPPGTSTLLYSSIQAFTAADAAVTQALGNIPLDGIVDADFLSASNALGQAQANFSALQGALISTGVNLIFGEALAGIDNALGLPPGTISNLVSVGIQALVLPGIGWAQLGMQLLAPLLGPMFSNLLGGFLGGFGLTSVLGGLLGGLFGGQKKRVEYLWTFAKDPVTGESLWPEQVPYVKDDKETSDIDFDKDTLKVFSDLRYDVICGSEEPKVVIAAAEGATTGATEEASSLELEEKDVSGQIENIKDVYQCDEYIVMKSKPRKGQKKQRLPKNVFSTGTKAEVPQQIKRMAAINRIGDLVAELYRTGSALYPDDEKRAQDMIPAQVWTYPIPLYFDRVEAFVEPLLTEPDGYESYEETVEETTQRKGFGQSRAFLNHLHWHY